MVGCSVDIKFSMDTASKYDNILSKYKKLNEYKMILSG